METTMPQIRDSLQQTDAEPGDRTQTGTRFISQLTRDTFAIILAGGRGSRLQQLTEFRTKPAVHFAGKFRIIDFTLSNCINSGIRRIGVATQYKAHSLIRHIQRGWSFLDGRFDEFIQLLPAQQQTDACQWRYECEQCHAMLRPKPGDCCVYCSYGSVPCPPIQERGNDACGHCR